MHHHGLVKILIEAHLRNKGDNWENYLVQNHFNEVDQDEPNSKIRRSRRNFPSNPNLKNKGLTTHEIPQDEHTQFIFFMMKPLLQMFKES